MKLMVDRFSTSMSNEEKMALIGTHAEMFAIHGDCFAGMLRAPVKGSHGYGINQAIVIVHAVMETPKEHAASILMDKNWDNVELVEESVAMVA